MCYRLEVLERGFYGDEAFSLYQIINYGDGFRTDKQVSQFHSPACS